MSHAHGEVWAIDGSKLIGRFEYNGTSDFATSAIAPSEAELKKNWRTPEHSRKCSCEPRGATPVILYSSYGGGFYWESTACLVCMSITGQDEPYPFSFNRDGTGNYAEDGHPFPEKQNLVS